MAEVAAVASMPMLEKPANASAAVLAKKKPPSSSSKDKKRKGKGLSNRAVTAEAPVTKKPRSSGAVATVAAHTAIRLVAGSKAMQTLICSRCHDVVVRVAGPRSTLPLLTDGQTLQQASMSNVLSQSEPQKAGCSSTTSPLIGSSGTKRKRPVVNQHKSLATKQFKPPMAKKLNSPVMMRSSMMRLLVSPLVVRPRSLALGLQPSRSPWRSPSCSPRRSPSRGPWAPPAHTPPSGATHPGSHDHALPGQSNVGQLSGVGLECGDAIAIR